MMLVNKGTVELNNMSSSSQNILYRHPESNKLQSRTQSSLCSLVFFKLEFYQNNFLCGQEDVHVVYEKLVNAHICRQRTSRTWTIIEAINAEQARDFNYLALNYK